MRGEAHERMSTRIRDLFNAGPNPHLAVHLGCDDCETKPPFFKHIFGLEDQTISGIGHANHRGDCCYARGSLGKFSFLSDLRIERDCLFSCMFR